MLRVSSETPSSANSAVKAIPAVQYYARELRNANENAPDGQEAQALEKYGLIDNPVSLTWRCYENIQQCLQFDPSDSYCCEAASPVQIDGFRALMDNAAFARHISRHRKSGGKGRSVFIVAFRRFSFVNVIETRLPLNGQPGLSTNCILHRKMEDFFVGNIHLCAGSALVSRQSLASQSKKGYTGTI